MSRQTYRPPGRKAPRIARSIPDGSRLRNLVQLFVRVGADDKAATLLTAINAADTAAFGADAARLDEASARLREAMEPEAFAAATTRGATMNPDATVAFALAAIDGLLEAK